MIAGLWRAALVVLPCLKKVEVLFLFLVTGYGYSYGMNSLNDDLVLWKIQGLGVSWFVFVARLLV